MVQQTLSLSRQAKKKGVCALFHMHQQQVDLLRLSGHAGRCLIFFNVWARKKRIEFAMRFQSNLVHYTNNRPIA